MEALGMKRKGTEILQLNRKFQATLGTFSSHLSLENYSRQRKKCKEEIIIQSIASSGSAVTGVATAPLCGISSVDPPGRGLKRKIGCIEAASRMRRKKRIDQEYDLGVAIGQGKFGSVVKCRSKFTGEEFACKTLRKGGELVHLEVEIMQHLSGNPGVVMLKAVYEDVESFHLVMELCSGGRLLDQMAKEGLYSEHRAANILKQLVLVIKYCHDMGVVHRDIKPENILLTNSGQMKLADFGLAMRMSNGQNLVGVVGSPAYVAPEVLNGEYSEKVDIWSAGVLLHALLVGVLPFQGDSIEAVFKSIKKVNIDFNNGLWDSISQPAKDLVANMLTRDVSARLTAKEILNHPWIVFYTESTVKTLTHRPTMRSRVRSTSQALTVKPRMKLKRNKAMASESLSDEDCPIVCSGNSVKRSEQDHSLIDALTVAISHINISEPKKSRLCGPVDPIQHQCSSNIKANNLCTAF